MERKEAIEILKKEYQIVKNIDKEHGGDFPEHAQALEMAISSLETDEAYQLEYEKPEFCADCISRTAVQNLTALVLSDYLHDEDREKIEKLDAAIGELPSVYPKSDAIPRERIEQMVAEIEARLRHLDWRQKAVTDIADIIHKYTKEQNNET